MVDFEDYPVQEHEMAGLGRSVADKLSAELHDWSIDKENGQTRPLWVLQGLAAAQAALDAERETVVKVARERGMSWAEIGESLGMSKQAVQQRYGR